MTQDLQYLIDCQQLRDIVFKAALALDSRRFDDWMDLCTPDVVLSIAVPGNPIRCEGKAAFANQLFVLNQFEATTHFTGNTLADIQGDRARTQTYCLAHHLARTPEGRTNLRQALRYHDTFARVDGTWLMTARHIELDWTELSDSPDPVWKLD